MPVQIWHQLYFATQTVPLGFKLLKRNFFSSEPKIQLWKSDMAAASDAEEAYNYGTPPGEEVTHHVR